MGQKVEDLDRGYRATGTYRVPVGANGNLASGQYIYRIIANGKPYSRTIMLAR